MMKKIFMMAMAAFALVACQNEPEGLNVVLDGEQDVIVNVVVPEAETRAGVDSAKSVFDNGILDGDLTMRYILQIYDENGNPSKERLVKYNDGKSVSFSVRLVPDRDYAFVVWADVVSGEADNDLYYNTKDGLDKVTIVESTWNAMDEARDAFTGKSVVYDFQGTSTIDVVLTRPFAKLRVVTTDFDELAKFDIKAKKAVATYTTKHYRTFNAYGASFGADAGEARDYNVENVAHEYTITKYSGETTGDNHTIFTDYFFASAGSPDIINLTLDVYEDDAKQNLIKSNNFNTDIPVQRNYLTTLKGDVLTTNGNVSVVVKPGFGDEIVEKYADNAETLQEIINEAPVGEQTNITLGGDIDLNDLLNAGILSTRASEPTYGLLIPADKKVVLDLKGYTISQTKTQTTAYSMIDNRGTLIIKDSSEAKTGKLNYTDNGQGGEYASNTLNNSGVLTIESGTIENNSSATVAANGYPHPIDNSGTLVINGGTFTNNANYSSMRIWCTTDDNTIVTINGGTFNGSIDFQTPSAAANKGTLTINGGTFNADTYTKTAVRLLGFGADVDEMNGYISGGFFNGAIALRNWSGSEFNSKVFNITGGTFTTDAKAGTDEAFINDDYAWVEEANDFWTVERKPDVAKIGEEGYTSLAKAVAAAQNGDTITFVADVEQVDGVLITDKNITIDLNDKTFTVSNGANTNNRNFKVNGSSVVTIKNGTMVAAGEYSSGAYGTLRTEGTANVTLNDVKLYNYRGNGLNVKVYTGTTVTINNSEIYSQYGGGVEAAGGIVELTNVKIEQKGMYTAPYNSMAISVNGGGTATVNSGTYSTECLTAEEANNQGTSHGPWCAGVLNSGGTLIIKGGTFSNDNYGDNALATYARGLLLADTAANIQIEGGVFNAVKAIVDIQNNLGDASKNPSATILGGDFSFDPRISASYSSNLIKVATGYKVVENNGRWAVVVDPAAKIGDVEYAILQEAFNVGGEITLLRNVAVAETVVLAEGKTVVLDLNGKTLSHANEETSYVINNLGNLTITGNGTVNARGIYNGYSSEGGIATAKLTIENGTFNAKGTNGGAAVFNYGIADIKGGSFTSIGGYSFNNQVDASMTIANGVVANNGVYATNATVVINGGEISGNRSGCHVIYGWNANITINGGTLYNNNSGNSTVMAAGTTVITYNDGTFGIKDGRVPGNGNTWTSCLLDSQNSATVVINNGIYNGGFRVQSGTSMTINGGSFNDCYGSNYNIYGTVAVKGGTYTDDTAKGFANKYIADGYEMNANGEVVVK